MLDGYQFTTPYQQELKNHGVKIVCIDDSISYHFVADAVINHAGGLKPEDYSCEQHTKLFLGPQYALIKPLFYQKKKIESTINYRKLLVALGGADPRNETDKVLETVSTMDFDELHVLLGGPNKNAELLKEKYRNNTTVSFHQNLLAVEVSKLMSNCSKYNLH